MKTFHFNLIRGKERESIHLSIAKVVNAGFAGRDQKFVRKHIEELKKEGVPAPERTPTIYPVSPNMITQDSTIHVLDGRTSGEAEYVLIITDDKVYVGVGSDHTDRDLEVTSISKSKQIYPNVISKEIWLLEDIQDIWDQLLLRSWVVVGKERKLYQEARLSTLLTPDSLMNFVKSKLKDNSMYGLLIYSGTVSVLSAEIIFGEGFEVELLNPINQIRLTCSYEIHIMDFLEV